MRYEVTLFRIKKNIYSLNLFFKQEPHHHNRPPQVFPEVLNSENYCRNAGGEEPVPWCYTMDPRVRWQHCDIPLCGKCFRIALFPTAYLYSILSCGSV